MRVVKGGALVLGGGLALYAATVLVVWAGELLRAVLDEVELTFDDEF